MSKRLLFIISVLLFVSAGAFAQVGGYSSTATDTTGKRLSLPTVKVCTDALCATTATIYKDAAQTALSNPFTGDSQGNYSFYAAPGNYFVQVAKAGYGTLTTPANIGGDAAQTGNNAFTGSNTHTGTETFSGGLYDDTSTVLRPAEFAGADLCAKISAAFAFAISSGWTSATVDARQRQWEGRQNCAASPFAGASNNGTFTGKLLTQGAQFVMTNSALPVIVPGGITWDGGGPRSLVSPPRNFAGTSVQPASAYSGGSVLDLGSVLDSSSPQATRIMNMGIGCVPPSGSYVNGQGTIGVRNQMSQEMSGGSYVVVWNCQTGFDVENTTGQTWITSGFDSSGFEHITVHTPNDPAAVGIMYGGSSTGLAHVYGFHDVSITGDPVGVAPGAANGTAIDLEGSDVIVEHLRCAYVGTCIAAGLTQTATALEVTNVSVNSNSNNAWNYIANLGSHANFSINLRNIIAVGPGTGSSTVLHDANYPGAACDLLEASGETGFGFYSRGVGGGSSGIVMSTIRNGCISKNNVTGVFSTSNIWTATQTHQATVSLDAVGTATSGSGNFSSNGLRGQISYWNGTAAATGTCTFQVNAGGGTTPTGLYKFGACLGTGGGSTDVDMSSTRFLTINKLATASNCSSSASPAVCAASIVGSVAIPAGATSLTVNTTSVTTSSQIIISEDSSLSTKLGVTCNTTLGRTYAVTGRVSSTSFTIASSAAPTTNPACLSYTVIN